MKKTQFSLETLMVTAWVFLAVMAIFSVAYAFGVFEFESFREPYCIIYNMFECEDFGFDSDGDFYMKLHTDSGVDVGLLEINITSKKEEEIMNARAAHTDQTSGISCKTGTQTECETQTVKLRTGSNPISAAIPKIPKDAPAQIIIDNPKEVKRFTAELEIKYIFVDDSVNSYIQLVQDDDLERIRTAKGEILIS
jgi:hypothetical protein